MAKLLHIALLISCAYAAASPCKDGSLDIVKGTRCRRYAECKNGSWHLKECKFGQIFDSKRVKCASVTEVGKCNDGTKCSEGRAYSYLGSTSLYYRCINGRISVQVCGTGEVFDPNLQYCRLDQSFQHSGLGRAKRNADDACVEGTKKRDGKSCKGYIECIDGKEVKKTCSDCMNFDDKTLTCRFVFLSPCGDPTPAPPTTQDPPTSATPDPPVTTPDTPPTKTDPPVTTPDTPPTETDPTVTTPDTPPTETDPTVTFQDQ
nr:uncharacterized protein LOC112210696 [Halyomorpha halys]